MTRGSVTAGNARLGKPRGMPPNSEPIVATPSNWNAACSRRGQQQRQQRPRHAPDERQARGKHDGAETGHPDRQRRPVQLRQRLQQQPHFIVEVFAPVGGRPRK